MSSLIHKQEEIMQDIIVEECSRLIETDTMNDAVKDLIETVKEEIGGTDYLARKIIIEYLERQQYK